MGGTVGLGRGGQEQNDGPGKPPSALRSQRMWRVGCGGGFSCVELEVVEGGW